MKSFKLLLCMLACACASISVRAQYYDDMGYDDFLYEDYFDLGPEHTEYKNQFYFSFMHSRTRFDGATPKLYFNDFGVGYNRSIQVVEKKPFFVEMGGLLGYSCCPGDDAHGNANYQRLVAKIPVSVTYKFYFGSSDVALAPLAGVYLRGDLMGKEKRGGVKTSLYDEDVANTTGAEWSRFQLGWQAGVRLSVKRFYVTATYAKDFPDDKKLPKMDGISASVGVCF